LFKITTHEEKHQKQIGAINQTGENQAKTGKVFNRFGDISPKKRIFTETAKVKNRTGYTVPKRIRLGHWSN